MIRRLRVLADGCQQYWAGCHPHHGGIHVQVTQHHGCQMLSCNGPSSSVSGFGAILLAVALLAIVWRLSK